VNTLKPLTLQVAVYMHPHQTAPQSPTGFLEPHVGLYV